MILDKYSEHHSSSALQAQYNIWFVRAMVYAATADPVSDVLETWLYIGFSILFVYRINNTCEALNG